MPEVYHHGSFAITTDPERLDVDVIHSYLTRSYWKRGVPKALVSQSLQNSLCFGLFEGEAQVGFARVVSDYTDFAYLCDVFVLETHQGQGLGKWLIQTVVNHPLLRDLRSFFLATRDAHGLYRHFGFQDVTHPERLMVRIGDRPWYIPDPPADSSGQAD